MLAWTGMMYLNQFEKAASFPLFVRIQRQ